MQCHWVNCPLLSMPLLWMKLMPVLIFPPFYANLDLSFNWLVGINSPIHRANVWMIWLVRSYPTFSLLPGTRPHWCWPCESHSMPPPIYCVLNNSTMQASQCPTLAAPNGNSILQTTCYTYLYHDSLVTTQLLLYTITGFSYILNWIPPESGLHCRLILNCKKRAFYR